ncbi:DUF6508 domain-containing protein [Rhodococcus gordoniae]|uniref:DUF6508 domain-containing protein n=1 Tax=Rhodococcus gordoniae TaxID=223392 RepID=UPI0011C060DA|nr:DUF6508 domain-containing protein [Rhodococcus gordoniae]
MGTELDDAPFIEAIDAMTPRDWEELRSLVSNLDSYSSSCARDDTAAAEASADLSVVGWAWDFLHDRGLIVPFDWPSWEGKAVLELSDPRPIGHASAADCLRYLTVSVRADRYVVGAFESYVEDGLMGSLLRRLLETTGNAS